ncbi:MAG: phosphotransferase [Rhodothermaceae bacterium]|nr:phosphotransferase [Rhodothermaceae bacterium]
MRPECTIEEARALARDLYGIKGDIKQLASYSDQNFLVGREYVLKVANSSEPEPVLRFQQAALQHVYDVDPSLNTPQVISMSDGRTLALWDKKHLVWMVNYIPGQFMSDVKDPSQELLFSLGAYLGRLDHALHPFSHEAMRRDLQWDLQNASRLESFLTYIEDTDQKELVSQFLQRFNTRVAPRFMDLRASVIHNDANDNNILVSKTADQIKGIIDFGDMVYSYTICELAIAVAYMILDKEDILDTAGSIVKGYHSTYSLQPVELDVLYDLICIRLCTSVCMSARERRKAPDNEYLAISEKPAWRALHQLAEIDPSEARQAFAEATQ